MALESGFSNDNIKVDKGVGNRGIITESVEITTKPAFAVVNPDGTNIGSSLGISDGLLSTIRSSYPTARVESDDVFTTPEGHARDCGFHYHDQSNSAALRPGWQFSKISARGWSAAVVTDNSQGCKAVIRKSPGTKQLPYGTKKLILGFEWAYHGWWLHAMYRVMFSLDTQVGNNVTGKRQWFKVGYVRSINGTTDDNKWQYDSAKADTPTWVDIPGGQLTSAWNEQYKPTFGSAYAVFDVENNRYEKLYTNGTSIDMTGLTVTNGGTTLLEYPDCYNVFFQCENRSSGSTNMAGLYLDRVLVAVVL